jgi:hypothetical protein
MAVPQGACGNLRGGLSTAADVWRYGVYTPFPVPYA